MSAISFSSTPLTGLVSDSLCALARTMIMNRIVLSFD